MTPWLNAIRNVTVTEQQAKVNWKKEPKICQHCGKTYKSARSDSIYCSNSCRSFARKAKIAAEGVVLTKKNRPAKLATPATCVVCGKQYIRTNGSQKGCSYECRYTLKRAAHKRHREKADARPNI